MLNNAYRAGLLLLVFLFAAPTMAAELPIRDQIANLDEMIDMMETMRDAQETINRVRELIGTDDPAKRELVGEDLQKFLESIKGNIRTTDQLAGGVLLGGGLKGTYGDDVSGVGYMLRRLFGLAKKIQDYKEIYAVRRHAGPKEVDSFMMKYSKWTGKIFEALNGVDAALQLILSAINEDQLTGGEALTNLGKMLGDLQNAIGLLGLSVSPVITAMINLYATALVNAGWVADNVIAPETARKNNAIDLWNRVMTGTAEGQTATGDADPGQARLDAIDDMLYELRHSRDQLAQMNDVDYAAAKQNCIRRINGELQAGGGAAQAMDVNGDGSFDDSDALHLVDDTLRDLGQIERQTRELQRLRQLRDFRESEVRRAQRDVDVWQDTLDGYRAADQRSHRASSTDTQRAQGQLARAQAALTSAQQELAKMPNTIEALEDSIKQAYERYEGNLPGAAKYKECIRELLEQHAPKTLTKYDDSYVPDWIKNCEIFHLSANASDMLVALDLRTSMLGSGMGESMMTDASTSVFAGMGESLASGHELRQYQSVPLMPGHLQQVDVYRQPMSMGLVSQVHGESWTYYMGPILMLHYQGDAAVRPNDPLFQRGGSSGSVSKVAKGVGKLLSFGLSVGGIGGGFGGGGPVVSKGAEAEDQWGLHRVGYKQLSDPQSAWRLEDGAKPNVVVAVIDSGLDMSHPDGPANLWTNTGEVPGNGKDDDGNGYVDDIHGWNFFAENDDLTDDFGHGTFVAGIIAAKRDNGIGIAGINPGARIMVLKVGAKEEAPNGLGFYRALRYAVDNGAKVINISLGTRGYSKLLQVGINYAHAMGAIVVVAAGNEGGLAPEHAPAGLRRAFSVTAMDMDGARRRSANRGANVALIAPGESIYSLTSKDGVRDGVITPKKKGTEYHRLSGTSFAAPMVTATASLLWAHRPELSNDQVEDILLASAEDVFDEGWDEHAGAGLLDAYAALSLTKANPLVARITELHFNKDGSKVKSLDVYGVVRGDLKDYAVEIGKGHEARKFKTVCEPVGQPAAYTRLCRIDAKQFKWSDEWTVQVKAADTAGQEKIARLPVNIP